MTHKQRVALIWLAPLPLAALPFLIGLDGYVPDWLMVIAAIPCMPVILLTMFSVDGGWGIFASIAFGCIVWYVFGVAMLASLLRRLARRAFPLWEKIAIVFFLLIAAICGVSLTIIRDGQNPAFGG